MSASRLDVTGALADAAERLAGAKRPVCIAGRGALWAGASDALHGLCAKLPRLRVASTPGAKGVFPERHPQALGVWGFSGHAAAERAVAEADLLLVLGTRLFEQSTNDWHPRLFDGRVIRVDLDPVRAEPLTPNGLGLLGDARAVLEALERSLPTGTAPSSPFPVAAALPTFEGRGDADRWVKPQALLGALGKTAPGVPVCADAGNAMCWAIEWLERNAPGDFQVSLDWGTMGFALPAAIGVSLSRGGAPAIALTGDGSMAMAGGDLHTAVELEIPLIVVALNDAGSGMIRAGSRAWFGPHAVPDPDYRYRMNLAQLARSLGARAQVITSCDDFVIGLEQALIAEAPTLLDVQVDPDEVPRAIVQRVRGLASDLDVPVKPGGGMC